MNLVEAEETGPVEGDEPLITPPRPPHRRVSVSLMFTLTILIGTVVAIYLRFPARHNQLMTDAMAAHEETEPAWDLVAPTPVELKAWAIGVVGKDPPLPLPATKITGARKVTIFSRDAALIGTEVGGDHVTYFLQRAQGIAPDHAERSDGDTQGVSWKKGAYLCIAVGPAATMKTWRAAFP